MAAEKAKIAAAVEAEKARVGAEGGGSMDVEGGGGARGCMLLEGGPIDLEKTGRGSAKKPRLAKTDPGKSSSTAVVEVCEDAGGAGGAADVIHFAYISWGYSMRIQVVGVPYLVVA